MSNAIRSVHRANKEINTDEFDYVAEWQRLRSLARCDSVAVGVIVGADLRYVNHIGPGIVKNFITPDGDPDSAMRFNGQVVIQYRKGSLYGANGQKGEAREYRCNPKFYHRDRVAEILRLDMEAA